MADCSSNLRNLFPDVFGLSSFRQGQFEASLAVLEGQDVEKPDTTTTAMSATSATIP